MLPYKYHSLGSGEIRLLQLLPLTSDVENDNIRFHIFHVAFKRCNVPVLFFSYEGLFYVWGGQRTETVYCNDHTIKVMPNLVSALSRLRHMLSVLGYYRTLWVDSICLNQSEVPERG